PMPIRSAWHELRNALRAGAAHRPRVEAALLPDDAGEELDRKPILRRLLFERAADIVSGRRARFFGSLLRRRRHGNGLRNGVRAPQRRSEYDQWPDKAEHSWERWKLLSVPPPRARLY